MRFWSSATFAFCTIGLSIAAWILVIHASAGAAYPDLTPAQVAEKCDNTTLRLNGKGQDPGLNKEYSNLTNELNRLDRLIYKDGPSQLEFWQQKVIELDAAEAGADQGSMARYAATVALALAQGWVKATALSIGDAKRAKPEIEQLRTAVDNERKYLNAGLLAYRCAASLDLSGDWKFTWEWSVTAVEFVGTLSGAGNSWSYQGTLNGGGNAVWHPKKGDGSAHCTLTGNIGKPGHISCSANFAGSPPSSWAVEGDGTVEGIFDGKKHQIMFRGRGLGTGGDGKPASADLLELQPGNG